MAWGERFISSVDRCDEYGVFQLNMAYKMNTDILAYSDTAYSDILATVTLLTSPKSFVNRKHSFQLFVVVSYICSVSYQLVSPSLAQCYSNLALF